MTRRRESWLVRRAHRWFEAMGTPPVRVSLWDGTVLGPLDSSTGVQIRDRGALLRLLFDPELQAGDLYSDGRVEIEGDPVEFVSQVYTTRPTGVVRWRWLARLIDGARKHDLTSARRNAQHHYD